MWTIHIKVCNNILIYYLRLFKKTENDIYHNPQFWLKWVSFNIINSPLGKTCFINMQLLKSYEANTIINIYVKLKEHYQKCIRYLPFVFTFVCYLYRVAILVLHTLLLNFNEYMSNEKSVTHHADELRILLNPIILVYRFTCFFMVV